jgi:hypothetical protein
MWLKLAIIGYNWQKLNDFRTFPAIFTFFRSWNTLDAVLERLLEILQTKIGPFLPFLAHFILFSEFNPT